MGDFAGNRLTQVTIPSSATSIWQEAFSYNTGLRTVILTKPLYDDIVNSDPNKTISELLLEIFGSQATRYEDIGDSTKTFPNS